MEARLASLTPAAARFDRDRLMYAAGQAGCQSRQAAVGGGMDSHLRRWKVATLALAVSVVVLASVAVHAYISRPGVERVVVRTSDAVKTPSAVVPIEDIVAAADVDSLPQLPRTSVWRDSAVMLPASATGSYLHLRNMALVRGVEAIPVSRPAAVAPSPSPTVRELLEELLPGTADDDQTADYESSI